MRAPALLFMKLKMLLFQQANKHCGELFIINLTLFLMHLFFVYLKFQFSLFPEIIEREREYKPF